jgi:hypothetical protein
VKQVKIIFAAVLVALILGISVQASAETAVTFSGYLRIRAFGLGGFFPNALTSDKRSDRYAVSRFRLNVVFKPNENIEVRWRVHAPHAARWGDSSGYTSASNNFRTIYVFGIIKTDYGRVSIGRISSDIDSAGLQTLGYSPTWGFSSQGYIFDSDSEQDGIMYRHDWDNGFGLKAFYIKKATETDVIKDGDYDRISIEPYYKWELGGVSFAVQYDRDMRSNVAQNYFYTFNPAFVFKPAFWDDLGIIFHFEGKYSKGKRVNAIGGDEITQQGLGIYADLNVFYPSGDVTLAGWWFDGDDEGVNADPNRRRNLVTSGEAFYPFIIFNYDTSTFAAGGIQTLGGKEAANYWALALLGNHTINEYLTLNYAIGNFNRVGEVRRANNVSVSNDLGTEVDLGLVVKIMDNLQYSTKAAFFIPGDFYKEYYGRPDFDSTAWGWAHELIFSF